MSDDDDDRKVIDFNEAKEIRKTLDDFFVEEKMYEDDEEFHVDYIDYNQLELMHMKSVMANLMMRHSRVINRLENLQVATFLLILVQVVLMVFILINVSY